ncbi:serine/threonine-protein kinase [Streptomyces sp. NPDC018031]|uniref:serine/threonine-protein kinase n=1 Tax=Streptomyces sp. NPDC018031 TaxID=3365033 RepID=UPI0037BAAD5C
MSDQGRLIAGRYRLVDRIGRGGMGTVWRAEDELLGRQVAVKQLHISPHRSEDELATVHERTRREARSAARITHPNVVVVHDVVDHEGQPCIVMEYVPSTTLGDVIKSGGPITPAEAARIGRGMIAALRAAHAAGVLHRDVKPGNVLLGRVDPQDEARAGGRVVLTDFGIAMASGTSTLTKTGEVVGSIDYIAPERVKGRKPGPASDLWALGATLYQAVEGRPPFRRATAMETAYAIAMDPLEPLRNAGPLTGLIEALLAKDPDRRPSADQVERALRAPASEAETAFLEVSFGTASLAAPAPAPAPTPAEDPAPAPAPAPVPAPAPAPADPGDTPRNDPPPAAAGGAASGAVRPADSGATPTLTPVPGPERGGRRGRGALLTAVAAVTVLAVAAGTFYFVSQNDGDGVKTGAKSEGEKTPGTGTKGHPDDGYRPPPVPEGYRLVEEKALGVSFPVPEGWVRQPDSRPGEVDYIDPTGLVNLQLNVLDLAAADPLEHFKDVEQMFQNKYPVSERLRLQRTRFRGEPAAIWEFKFKGSARWFRAIDLGWGQPGLEEYAVYLSAPEAQWQQYRGIFDHVRDGLRFADDEGAGATGGAGQ